MKIPRRTLFIAQLVACIIGSLTQSMLVSTVLQLLCLLTHEQTVSCCGCLAM